MTPDEKSLLERTYKLSEENNAILRGIRRSNRLSAVMRILYWAVIILSGLAAYYFIQPYLNLMTGLYDQAKSGVGNVQSGADSIQNAADTIRDLLK